MKQTRSSHSIRGCSFKSQNLSPFFPYHPKYPCVLRHPAIANDLCRSEPHSTTGCQRYFVCLSLFTGVARCLSSLNCFSFLHKAVRLMPNSSVVLDLLPPVASKTSSMYFFSISTNVINDLVASKGGESAL